MVDYAPPPSYQFPPGRVSGPTNMRMRQREPTSMYSTYGSPTSPTSPTHSRTRTSSSSIFPLPASATYEKAYYTVGPRTPAHNPYNQGAYPGPLPQRRPGSTSTTTTTSTSQGRRSSTASMNVRRSDSTGTSSSSSTQTMAPAASAYVANLRRQKATVWCDRSQPEDPRLLAAQQMARQKAAMQVMGSSAAIKVGSHGLGSASASTSSMRNRLGKSHQPIFGVGTGSLVGDLPPRLSASEATGDSDEEDHLYIASHRRSGSGRSSLNSNHRKTNRTSTFNSEHRNSSYGALQRETSKGSSSRSYSPINPTIELTEPVIRGKTRSPQLVSPHILEERSPDVRTANGYFEVVPQPPPALQAVSDLRRQGSVDERAARTMTMTGLRLVVANPD